MVYGVADGAIVGRFVVAVVGKGVGDAGEEWFVEFIFHGVVEVLEKSEMVSGEF